MQKAVDLLYNMVKTPSVSGNERAIAELLVQYGEAFGFKTKIDEAGNFVGEIGHGSRQIILLGHMDTVPGGPKVRIENDILYGRGSVDAKGPLATFMMAVQILSQMEEWEALKDRWRLIVIGAVEEEAASSKGANFIKGQYQPDYCIIGEPSGWQGVTLGYKGRLRMDYSYARDTAHSAGPDQGVADDAFHYWSAIKEHTEKFNKDKSSVFYQLQSRIDEITTSLINQQDVVRASFSFRSPPKLTSSELKEALSGLNVQGDIHFYGEEEAYVSSRRIPFVPAFTRAINHQAGKITFKHKTGTSDMNVVGPVWQCPIVAYGPGDSSLDHTPNEHLFLSEYLKAIEVLKGALIGLMTSVIKSAVKNKKN